MSPATGGRTMRSVVIALAMLLTSCSSPAAPEPKSEPRLQNACMAWPAGGIICCDIGGDGGSCVYYAPPE